MPDAPGFRGPLVDTHAHLHDAAFGADLDAVLTRADAAGVRLMVTIGTDPASSHAAAELARRHPAVYAAAGIHPHDAGGADAAALRAIATLAAGERVVAVGEIGLDFYRDLAPRRAQEEAFRAQLTLARELRRPILLHCRDAHEALIAALVAEGVPACGGIMHCFSGDGGVLRRCLDLGLTISVAGPVTYPSARRLQDTARLVPRDRLVIETDCPYLPPQPWRGRRNEPAYLVSTAVRLAEILGLAAEEVAQLTTGNACAVLGLPLPGPD